jgi:capsular exopolysaccharide synthesis family protein
MKTPPTYESSAEILLMPKDPALAARGVESGHNVDATLSTDLLATHMILIKSPIIVEEALKNANLMELPSLLEKMSPSERSPANYVMRQLTSERDGKDSQILCISMEHSNAEDAQLIVQAIVDQFRDFINKKYTDVNQSAAELITKAQKQLEDELGSAEKAYREFSEQAPILVGNENSTNVYRAEFEQIESKLTDVRLERAEKESRLKLVDEQLQIIREQNGSEFDKLALIGDESADRIKVFLEVLAGRQDSLFFMAKQPERAEVARGEYADLLKLKAELRSLEKEFGSEHSKVQNVKSQIEIVESFIDSRSETLKVEEMKEELTADKIIDAYVSLLRHDIRASESREQLLLASSKESEKKAKDLLHLEFEGESLKKSVERQKELFNATVDRLHEINLAKDYGGFVNETIRKPMIGNEVWPKLPLCVVLGTVLGLCLAGGIAVVMELQNRSLRNVEEIEQITGTSVISMIPKMVEHLDPEIQERIRETSDPFAPIIIAHHQPKSREAEVFRGLRTTLLFKANSMSAKTIGFTSPTAGDGKSTISLNLAVSLARAGQRVLIMDTDMRRPTLAKNLGLQSPLGLSDILTEKAKFEDAILHTVEPNLHALLTGKTPENPSELLTSPQFRTLLTTTRAAYDFVILDCPPVLAVVDPCIIATEVDAVVLVLRVNAKSKIELQRTKNLLAEVNAPILGTVVNASRLETINGDKISYHGVGYGYGSYGGRASAYFRPGQTSGGEESNGHTRREGSQRISNDA